jgi:outer membrane protein OmpA-like peptidoglycan-associated protein
MIFVKMANSRSAFVPGRRHVVEKLAAERPAACFFVEKYALMKPVTSLFLNFCLVCSLLAQRSTLKADYFNGVNFDEKVTSRTEYNIDKEWNDVPPVPGIDPHHCSIRWTGQLVAPATGTYAFSARVDDGIRVWVGGVQVIDNWRLNDVGHSVGRVKMKAGTSYDLKVEYFNALVEGEITLLWQLPDAEEFAVVERKYFEEKPKPAPAPVKPATNPVATKPELRPTSKPTNPPAKVQPSATKPVILPKDTLEKYIPKNVLFEQGKPVMLDTSKPDLDKLAGFLLRNASYQLKIEGHTDIIGDAEMNKTLSEERAQVVADYLATQGVGQERLTAKGYGSSRPLVKGNSKKGYPENRRVAFIVFTK